MTARSAAQLADQNCRLAELLKRAAASNTASRDESPEDAS